MPEIPIDTVSFNLRSKRIEYLVRRFSGYLVGSVLDVGCDAAFLRDLLPAGASYTGIDISGNPDIFMDLEKTGLLPLADASYDTVVCTDVLEHLDNLHQVFQELVRVSQRYLVISLPNNWINARCPIARGRGHIGHYGLPIDPPADRHKWFFSFSEAKDFLEGQARKFSLLLVEMRATEKPRASVIRFLLRLISFSEERYLNRYAHTIWAVMEKKV